MRTTGSLRVVLNTKLWPEMICEKVNEKNIRISATDNEHVRSDAMFDCRWWSIMHAILWSRDVHLGSRILIFLSRSRVKKISGSIPKNFSVLTQEIVSKLSEMIQNILPGSGSWFFTHPGSRIQGSNKYRIRNTACMIVSGKATSLIKRPDDVVIFCCNLLLLVNYLWLTNPRQWTLKTKWKIVFCKYSF